MFSFHRTAPTLLRAAAQQPVRKFSTGAVLLSSKRLEGLPGVGKGRHVTEEDYLEMGHDPPVVVAKLRKERISDALVCLHSMNVTGLYQSLEGTGKVVTPKGAMVQHGKSLPRKREGVDWAEPHVQIHLSPTSLLVNSMPPVYYAPRTKSLVIRRIIAPYGAVGLFPQHYNVADGALERGGLVDLMVAAAQEIVSLSPSGNEMKDAMDVSAILKDFMAKALDVHRTVRKAGHADARVLDKLARYEEGFGSHVPETLSVSGILTEVKKFRQLLEEPHDPDFDIPARSKILGKPES